MNNAKSRFAYNDADSMMDYDSKSESNGSGGGTHRSSRKGTSRRNRETVNSSKETPHP